MYIDLNAQVRTQQAHHLESVCNFFLGGGGNWWPCIWNSTKKPGVFHVEFFMWIIGVDLHVDIK